jgi:hypothetical protein
VTLYHVCVRSNATLSAAWSGPVWVEVKNPDREDGRWEAADPLSAYVQAHDFVLSGDDIYLAQNEFLCVPQHRFHLSNGNRPYG